MGHGVVLIEFVTNRTYCSSLVIVSHLSALASIRHLRASSTQLYELSAVELLDTKRWVVKCVVFCTLVFISCRT